MRKNRKGFTVIEVVLVLAVAGMIFAMVFVAIPALQVSRRDTDRKTDIQELISGLKKYQQNNRGALPSKGTSVNGNSLGGGAEGSWTLFYQDYLGDKYRDPLGYMYNLQIVECGASADSDCTGAISKDMTVNGIREQSFSERNYTIVIVTKARCDGNKAVGTSNPRNVAAMYKLEGPDAFCANT